MENDFEDYNIFKKQCEEIGGDFSTDENGLVCRIDRGATIEVVFEDDYSTVFQYSISGVDMWDIVEKYNYPIVDVVVYQDGNGNVVLEGNTQYGDDGDNAKFVFPEEDVTIRDRKYRGRDVSVENLI